MSGIILLAGSISAISLSTKILRAGETVHSPVVTITEDKVFKSLFAFDFEGVLNDLTSVIADGIDLLSYEIF